MGGWDSKTRAGIGREARINDARPWPRNKSPVPDWPQDFEKRSGKRELHKREKANEC